MPTKTLRRAMLGALAAVAAIGGTLALSDTASADFGTPWCVTRYEYSRVRRGMTYDRVTRIIGRRAWNRSPYGGPVSWSNFRTCPPGDGWFEFDTTNRVTGKHVWWYPPGA